MHLTEGLFEGNLGFIKIAVGDLRLMRLKVASDPVKGGFVQGPDAPSVHQLSPKATDRRFPVYKYINLVKFIVGFTYRIILSTLFTDANRLVKSIIFIII